MKDAGSIVVTGASSGIGKSVAIQLSNSGYNVIATARRKEKLNEIYRGDSNIQILPWDLSELSSIAKYAEQIRDLSNCITGIVHCAGIEKSHAVTMIKERILTEVFYINTFAAMLLVSQFSKRGMMVPGGSFVLLSSAAAYNGTYGQSVYTASKSALNGFVKATASELAEKQLRINAIAPGIVQTEMIKNFYNKLENNKREEIERKYPLGIGEPSDVANFIEYLISDKSKWITGQVFILDGGFTVRKP